MLMSTRLRKAVLTTHITTSVGLLGAIAAFCALSLAGLSAVESATIRAAYVSMDVVARFVIAPLAIFALLTGIAESLGTHWGLFRHYWIVAKLILTAVATAVLLIKLDLIARGAGLAREHFLPSDELHAVGKELTLHAIAGFGVLLVPAILSVYKPLGLTPYGRTHLKDFQTTSTSSPPFSREHLRPANHADTLLGTSSLTIRLHKSHALAIAAALVILHIAILHFTGIVHGH